MEKKDATEEEVIRQQKLLMLTTLLKLFQMDIIQY